MRRMLARSLTALVLAGCTGSAEQPILSQLFTASRLHDTTTLNGFSMVEIDPQKQGSVLSFSIVSVSAEAHMPLGLKSLPVVQLSVSDPRMPLEAAKFDGEMASKDVTVDANVRLPDGQSTRKTYVVTLQRALLKRPEGDLAGRWIVTNVRDTSARGGAHTSAVRPAGARGIGGPASDQPFAIASDEGDRHRA
jgi:hypothetical protein